MLKRYVGPEKSVSLSVAGTTIGTVAKGEAIFVPDEAANSVDWPSEFWEDGASKKVEAKSKKSDNTSSSSDVQNITSTGDSKEANQVAGKDHE